MNWPVKFAAKEKIEKINHSLPSFNIQSVIIISLSSFSFSSIFRNAKFISAKFLILADSRKLIPKISRFFQIAKVSFFPRKFLPLKYAIPFILLELAQFDHLTNHVNASLCMDGLASATGCHKKISPHLEILQNLIIKPIFEYIIWQVDQ